MKKYVIKSLKLLIVFIIFIGMTTVYGTDDYTCNLLITGNKENINAGETITYEIKATNINAETGIVMFEALIEYDSNIFECRVDADQAGNWSKTSMIDNYLTMSRSDYEANSQDQVIAILTLTAKNNVSANSYPVKLSGIKFTMDDDKYFEISDQTINVQIGSNNEITPDENTTNENTTNENTVNENTVNENTTSENTTNENTTSENEVIENITSENITNEDIVVEISDMNTSNNNITNEQNTGKNKLPYTGTREIISIMIIIAAIAIPIFFFIKYRNLDF